MLRDVRPGGQPLRPPGLVRSERVRFIVPRRPDGGRRDELWDYCRARWERHCPGIEIREGSSPDGPFNRSAALNDAARGTWDVAVIADADVVAEPVQVFQAVLRANAYGNLVAAYDRFVGLNQRITDRILAGTEKGHWERGARFRSLRHVSSLLAIRRDLWDEVGGFDERFVGWGEEDTAFASAARVLRGFERIEGNVYHLYHQRQSPHKTLRPEWHEAKALSERYQAAQTTEEMRALLAERVEVYAPDGKTEGTGESDSLPRRQSQANATPSSEGVRV